jgi:hypothetical protein
MERDIAKDTLKNSNTTSRGQYYAVKTGAHFVNGSCAP